MEDSGHEVGLPLADAPLGEDGDSDEAGGYVVAVLSVTILEQLFLDGSGGGAVGRYAYQQGVALVKRRAVGVSVRLGVIEITVD